MINLGDKVRDTVTGFTGIAFGITTFLNGCKRVGVQPAVDAQGKMQPSEWFDEPQLEVIEITTIKRNPSAQLVGGPMISIPTKNEAR